MRFVIRAVVLVSLILTLGCASRSVNEKPKIFLHVSPEHDNLTFFDSGDGERVQLLDNDGNLYVTHWDVGTVSAEVFSNQVSACKEGLVYESHFQSIKSVHDILEPEIRPVQYVPLLKCIYSHGYTLKAKDAFRPPKYTLGISQNHSSSQTYLKVGASFHISKAKANYIDVISFVKSCDAAFASKNGHRAEEVDGGVYLSLSIEGYVDDMVSCLEEASFNTDRLN